MALYSEPTREHCFSCNHTRFLSEDGSVAEHNVNNHEGRRSVSSDEIERIIEGSSITSIKSRGINQATCQKFNYRLRRKPSDGSIEHVAVYADEHGQPEWIKLRDTGTPDEPRKEFVIIGHATERFFGQHLWPLGGKRLVIVGGEIDALTVSMLQDNQWPVWSPGKGEKDLIKCIKANYEAVCSFDEVCLGMDMDAVGRQACEAAAQILPPGKAKIIVWPAKDPNEALLDGKGKEITRAIWNAEPYRPDGMLDARSVSIDRPAMGLPWPWRALTNWTLGRRPGEVYTLGGGTGLGKSDTLYETVAADIQGRSREGDAWEPQKWALFTYEAGPGRVKLEILSKLAQKRFKVPQGHPKCSWELPDLDAAMQRLDVDLGGRLFLMDGKGSPDWEHIKDLARYHHHAFDVKHFAIDPLSALVAGTEDERKELDRIVLEAASLAVELESAFYFYSHLTGPRGGEVGHERGAKVQLNQFRGSNGIGQFSAFVMGYERDTQADTPEGRCEATIRMVKDRLLGDSTGETFKLHYDRITGTLDCAYEEVPEEAEGYGD